MRSKTFLVTLSLLFVLVASVGLLVHAQKKTSCSTKDDEVYDGRVQPIRGKVIYLNHPDMGKTPATGQYLVFQREDCKDCLVATHVDIEGNYKIFVGVGRYKVIVQETRCDYGGNCGECHNLLAPGQAQYVDVKRGPIVPDFNINLVLPKQ